MKKLTPQDKELLDSVVQKHAPWIQKSIKHLRGLGKIGHQFEDDDFYDTGYNAVIEALSSYDSSKGSFKTHAQGIIKHRIQGQIEKEMARSGGGGVDPYFLTQARAERKAKELGEKKPEVTTTVMPKPETSTEPPSEPPVVPPKKEPL